MRCYKCTYNSLCGGSDFFMDCDFYNPVPVCTCGCTMNEVIIGKNIDNDKKAIVFICPKCFEEAEVEI